MTVGPSGHYLSLKFSTLRSQSKMMSLHGYGGDTSSMLLLALYDLGARDTV